MPPLATLPDVSDILRHGLRVISGGQEASPQRAESLGLTTLTVIEGGCAALEPRPSPAERIARVRRLRREIEARIARPIEDLL